MSPLIATFSLFIITPSSSLIAICCKSLILSHFLFHLIQVKCVGDSNFTISLNSKSVTFPAIYGQGFFFSWLLTATTAALSRLTRESFPVSRIEIASFIATLAYPLIAAYDTYLLGSVWDTQTGNHFRGQPFGPQHSVTVSVCHWAIVVTFILTVSDSSKWIRLIWPVVYCICVIPIMSGPNVFYSSLFELTANMIFSTIIGIAGNIGAYFWRKEEPDLEFTLNRLLSTIWWLGTRLAYWFRWKSESHASVRALELPKFCAIDNGKSLGLSLAYPQTSARITDMPQLLALAVAPTVFIIFSTPRIKIVREFWREHAGKERLKANEESKKKKYLGDIKV